MSKSKRRDELKQRWPKGCQPPNDYCAWHEWAEAQGLHGLKQGNCTACGRYCFPQELDDSRNMYGSCRLPSVCEEARQATACPTLNC